MDAQRGDHGGEVQNRGRARVSECNFETEELSARANLWNAPKWGSPSLKPVVVVEDEEGTDSTVPAKEVPSIVGYGIG